MVPLCVILAFIFLHCSGIVEPYHSVELRPSSPPLLRATGTSAIEVFQSNCGTCYCRANQFMLCEAKDTLKAIPNSLGRMNTIQQM